MDNPLMTEEGIKELVDALVAKDFTPEVAQQITQGLADRCNAFHNSGVTREEIENRHPMATMVMNAFQEKYADQQREPSGEDMLLFVCASFVMGKDCTQAIAISAGQLATEVSEAKTILKRMIDSF